MSDRRLFRFPKPQWLNSASTRIAGVYVAGALVRLSILPCTSLSHYLQCLYSSLLPSSSSSMPPRSANPTSTAPTSI